MKRRSKSLAAASMVALVAIFSFTVLMSHSKKEVPGKKGSACKVSCTWTAYKTGLSFESIDGCNGTDVNGALPSGSWTGMINFAGCTGQMGMTTGFTSSHPAGTLSFYLNGSGTPFLTHNVAANASLFYDDFVTVSCGDVVTIDWQ